MKVLKFGGSSVANAENIKKVVEILRATDGPAVVVLSAMQGTTDKLIDAGRLAERGDESYRTKIDEIRTLHISTIIELFAGEDQQIRDEITDRFAELEGLCRGVELIGELSARTLDNILSFGELLSTKIAAAYLTSIGVECEWADSRELIVTDSNFGFAAVDFRATNERVARYFAGRSSRLTILPGFIAKDGGGNTTTLGRGGSDYSAAIFAAALDADVLEIWTDVSGMKTADPRFVRNVRDIPRITYREAMELSHFGAKVIYPPTIQPVMAKGIPVWIKNTFAPDDIGTLIESETNCDGEIIRGISSIDKIAILNLEGSGMVGVPGFSRRLFDALSRAQINVILITQSSSEHSICVAVEEKASDRAKAAVDREFEYEIAVGKIDPLRVEAGLSILALVGDNMRSHTGVSGRMFSTLGHNGVNIRAIAQGSSERNISAIISSSDVRKAVNTLHEEFFSDGNKQINIFIAGVGTVGSKLLAQIAQQYEHIAEDLRLNLRVVGIANSKSALFAEEGIILDDVKSQFAAAQPMKIDEFTDRIIERNLRNSIFVDITASADVVETYPKLLRRSVSVIACNKVAASSDYESYRKLKDLAREYNANFFFETNVGAGLPVIHTLNDLISSGDKVNRIEAVLSGTLNFVFNNYDGTRKFAEVVQQAQVEGYTEPDPRLDLSGTDVARKILILAREAGYAMEMSEITNVAFLPESCLAGTVEDFYAEMTKQEPHFRKLLNDASAQGLKLKYIASLDGGKASVGLQSIGPEHNFANLSGKDNAVLFYTNRYSDQPLVIKGAGAGADVTAAGVFADIIRAAR
ncbi:MAG: bifunctional aspartate kinase/homoserine dehydrogenase I [Pyrinomonadaceae bacterium]|nr:bifunctional aspartate kinase/homoserine dehydrogenase I [Pyrinomonadaceae bacterium]